MKKFIGKKEILAEPMTRQQYNDYREWTLPANEDGSDDGFLVEYIDGGKPNHPDHKGYISWSPKQVFENAYRAADTAKDRLIIEIDELAERFEKLDSYIFAKGKQEGSFGSLDLESQDLLMQQRGLMMRLGSLLEARLEKFD